MSLEFQAKLLEYKIKRWSFSLPLQKNERLLSYYRNSSETSIAFSNMPKINHFTVRNYCFLICSVVVVVVVVAVAVASVVAIAVLSLLLCSFLVAVVVVDFC